MTVDKLVKDMAVKARDAARQLREIGRASCRERV